MSRTATSVAVRVPPSNKMAEAMYRAPAAAGAAPGDPAGAGGGDASGATADQAKGDVIDAEFKDLGDTKK